MAAGDRLTFLTAADRSWQLSSQRPGADLAAYIAAYQGYEEHQASHVRRRALPQGSAVLVINFGAQWRIADPRQATEAECFDSFVAGVDDFSSLVDCIGRALCLQVDFTPLGARRFFGVPMDELSRRVVGLAEVLGPQAAARLADRLFQAPDWAARFEIVEECIRARFANSVDEDAGIAWAWRRIARSGGQCSITRLARELGCSRKHLAARFRDQIGLTPKTYAGLIRFDRAVRLIGAGPQPDLAQIAVAAGYFDQSHFNRDFLTFSGITPGDFLRARLADGDGIGG